MSSCLFTKSIIRVSCLSGWQRFKRLSVWMHCTPPNFLSTNMVWSKGWSNPVWNLSATTKNFWLGCLNSMAIPLSLIPKPFIFSSVYLLPLISTSPLNATSAFTSPLYFSFNRRVMAWWNNMALARLEVTTMAFACPFIFWAECCMK